MTYKVREVYYTLQGEGAHAGRPAIFCRFTGCNLWSGHEKDRAQAICRFCDTNFVGIDGPNGGKFETAQHLVEHILHHWPKGDLQPPFIVFTGGEPALQLDQSLVDALHSKGAIVAIETNGTKALPKHIDWICVSPKAHTALTVMQGDELKLIYPQEGAEPARYANLDFKNFYLQPMDNSVTEDNIKSVIHYCLADPQWRLSLQTHKILGLD